MNTAALRLVIQTTQVRARDSGEASRTFADQAARTASADATRGPALERFASAYVDKVPDALEALLLQARAVACAAPLPGGLERALAGIAPAALAQTPWTAGWMTWTPASRRRSPSSAFSRGNGVAP